MRKLLALTVALVLTLAVLAHPTSHARLASSGTGHIGKVLLHCKPNANQQVDPIVKYSADDPNYQSAHLHTPIGADSFSASETPDQMLGADTSCLIPSDHDGLWFPTPLTPDGTPATLGLVGYYLVNHGYDITEEPPNGLRFIAGDSSYSGRFGHVGYICMANRRTSHTIPTVDDCPPGPNGEGYEMLIQSQGQCWYPADGLGEGMGSDSGPANITNDPQDECLAAGGQAIPQVLLAIGVHEDGIGGRLSSDPVDTPYPGSTGHFDFVFAFTPAADGNPADDPIALIDQQCLNDTWDTSLGTVSCNEGSSVNNPTPGVYEAIPDEVGRLGAFVTN